jgi:NhaA family Na+:H+ antiporter
MSASDPHNHERLAGLLLMGAAAAALILANTPLAPLYQAVLHAPLGPLTVHYWIADALMAGFFLLVGLEVKREWYDGQLSTAAARRLPILAAAGGMAVPALVYVLVTGAEPASLNGWAIPAATDIAFALGVLSLLGSRAPPSIKLLLVTIAIIDDIGAVIIIAAFYTAELHWPALLAAAGLFAAMLGLGRLGVRQLWPFLVGFVLLWLAVLNSGVHATIAGVLAAFAVPLGLGETRSPLKRLEHRIHPFVMFGIVPLFGFASAGVGIGNIGGAGGGLPSITLGVALGLFFGKQIGVFGAIWLSDRTGLARKPAYLSWPHLYAAALLCGIGFTMSLFIGELAFADQEMIDLAKIGTLLGSAMSVVAAYLVLRMAKRAPVADPLGDEAEEVFGENFETEQTLDQPQTWPDTSGKR